MVWPRIRDGGVGGSQPLSMVQHVDQAKGDDAHHVRTERQQEQEEVAVVSAPDAVVDPGAVVVKVLGRRNASGHTAGREGQGHKGRWGGWGGGAVTSTQLSQTLQWEQRGGR